MWGHDLRPHLTELAKEYLDVSEQITAEDNEDKNLYFKCTVFADQADLDNDSIRREGLSYACKWRD